MDPVNFTMTASAVFVESFMILIRALGCRACSMKAQGAEENQMVAEMQGQN